MTTHTYPSDLDVIVVGAGVAGLITARELLAQGLNVAVIEARDRVGGRTVNHTFSDGTVVEMGGQWIGPTQDKAKALVDELDLALYPTYDIGDAVALVGGKLNQFVGDSFGLTADALDAAGVAMSELEEMARSVPLAAPWTAARAAEWDAQTLATWIEQNVTHPQAKNFLQLLAPGVFSAEAGDMSLLHFLFYIHSGGLLEAMVNTTGGAQESRVRGGTQLISLRLAEQLGEHVLLSSPVRTISQDQNGVVVSHDGGRLRARRVVVTAPPAVAVRIQYDPPLPPLRDGLMQKMPMGYVIKTQVRYASPFWRERGLSGSAFSLDGDPASVVYDNSPEDGSCGVLLAFLEGRHGRELGQRTEAEREQVVLSGLAKYFGPAALDHLEYAEKNWAAEEFTRGCYGAHFATGVWTKYGPALAEPCGRIHWAGTETAEVWNGYIDGAIRSGERVAVEVAKALSEEAAAQPV